MYLAKRLFKCSFSNPFESMQSLNLHAILLLQGDHLSEPAVTALFSRNSKASRYYQEKLLFHWIQNPSHLKSINYNKLYSILHNSLSSPSISPRYKLRAAWLMAVLTNTLPRHLKDAVSSIDQDTFIPGFADFYPSAEIIDFLKAMRAKGGNPSRLITNYYAASAAHLDDAAIADILPTYLKDFGHSRATRDINDQLVPLLAFLESMNDQQCLEVFNTIVRTVQIEPMSFIQETLRRFLNTVSAEMSAGIMQQIDQDYALKWEPEHEDAIMKKYYGIHDLHRFLHKEYKEEPISVSIPLEINALYDLIDHSFANLESYPSTLGDYEGSFNTLIHLAFNDDSARATIKARIDEDYAACKHSYYSRFKQQLMAACELRTCLPKTLQTQRGVLDTESLLRDAVLSM
ncbi:hypothetical protein Lbir_1795 [Legionella birminghamensis]|uniref:Uncharacterized protein n=2 Tax=Legionella birminghamensis TaxID=28083 RepID=A0A378I6J2_9GAMM|nr:hypothetical protein Lbir_1795 [Legionella birminghamensis]STX30380.1 Uncharacterised protein [Legionella birminghamensis]